MRDAAALGEVCDVNEGGLWCIEGGHREESVMRDGGVHDVNEGGPWCMEGGHLDGSMVHMEGVYDARCGSFRGGL